jgi:hypothetical protein
VLPEQTVVLVALTVRLGCGLMVTVAVLAPLQPAELPVTVYWVLLLAVAVTLWPVVLLNPAAGLQVYELAPLAVNVTPTPAQLVGEFTVTASVGLTATLTVLVLGQPAALVPLTV